MAVPARRHYSGEHTFQLGLSRFLFFSSNFSTVIYIERQPRKRGQLGRNLKKKRMPWERDSGHWVGSLNGHLSQSQVFNNIFKRTRRRHLKNSQGSRSSSSQSRFSFRPSFDKRVTFYRLIKTNRTSSVCLICTDAESTRLCIWLFPSWPFAEWRTDPSNVVTLVEDNTV